LVEDRHNKRSNLSDGTDMSVKILLDLFRSKALLL
jgi:hypothetical protein